MQVCLIDCLNALPTATSAVVRRRCMAFIQQLTDERVAYIRKMNVLHLYIYVQAV
jgi:hypothetical protein